MGKLQIVSLSEYVYTRFLPSVHSSSVVGKQTPQPMLLKRESHMQTWKPNLNVSDESNGLRISREKRVNDFLLGVEEVLLSD